jgi:hypothetical protein
MQAHQKDEFEGTFLKLRNSFNEIFENVSETSTSDTLETSSGKHLIDQHNTKLQAEGGCDTSCRQSPGKER